MKFFWKIYFSFTVLLLLSFGIFGTWMIQLTFEKSYQRVLEEGERENRMFQLSFEMNMNVLDEAYRNEGIIPVTASSIIENLSDSGSIYQIYNGSRELLYESRKFDSSDDTLLRMLNQNARWTPCGHQLTRRNNDIYLVFVCLSVVDTQLYYLENIKNITDIYVERESYYDWYTIMVISLTAVITILVFIVTHMLTRSVGELSHTTKRFTMGDYEVRASERGGDEIADLACDFNNMADTISEKMEELTMQAKRQEDFTASFAHELKTPLTSIIGYADMLRTMDCTEEERLEAANYIFRQGKRLENLSFKLLELIVADKQTYAFRPFSVQELVNMAVRLTEVRRQKKGIHLVQTFSDGILTGERDLLISVFTNVLDNAAKAVEDGGTIWIGGRQYAKNYLLCISDNGCGMEQQEVSRITEAFYMVDKSRTRREGGAGLGLTLCSRILSLHDARWKIFSVPGRGTSIVIQFFEKEAGE